MDNSTLILGAGPAGMAAAMELVRKNEKVVVVEKASAIGGLSKTLTFNEKDGAYLTDIGPHRFFSKNKYLYDFIQDLLGEEWKEVPRLTRFFVDGKFYLYPVRMRDILQNMGVIRAGRMFLDYVIERLRNIVSHRKETNFEEYVLKQFGRSLAEFNMLNYTEKIWGIPCSQISVDWAYQRIKGLSVRSAILKMLFPKRSGPKSLVDSFYYPSFGTGRIYEAIRKRIESLGNPVWTSTEPTRITHNNGRVTAVTLRGPEGDKTLEPKNIVLSVPVTQSVKLFDPPPPQHVLDAAAGLRFRAQVYLFLTVNKESVMPDNWAYFPDKDIVFGRITEMKNFSKAMCPPGKTSLFVEFFCFEGDEIWTASEDDLYNRTMDVLERIDLLHRNDVTSIHSFRQTAVYPVYDLTYQENIRTVMQWLDSFQNLFAVGRPGRFRYTNQDHSLEMGILAAQSILQGKRLDIESPGAEKEYFERGYVPKA